jgi:hypothetical protein
VALAAAGVAAIAMVLGVIALVRLRRAARRSAGRARGRTGRDLVAHAAELDRSFAALHAYVEDVAARLDERVGTAELRLDGAIAHFGLVRYDAYNEMSGRQSTTIALLDASRSGVVLSAIHHRDQARLYAKQVVGGQGELELSPEEEEAVRARSSAACPPPDALRLPRPPGTFSEQALREAAGDLDAAERVAYATIHETIMAAQHGEVDAALVPIENSVEGAVNVTLDALAPTPPSFTSAASTSWPSSSR